MIVVTGHSMDPTYATGDLVVARCGRPQVGDVVVYQPDGVRGHIIHRLVGGNGVDGWQVKGDNNSWQDPFSPADADVVGVAKFHLPRIGLATTALAAPIVWAPLLVIAIAIFIWPRDDDEDAEPDDRAAAEPGDEDADADADPHAIATSRDGQDVLL